MSIETFVKGLLPSFDSARINEDIELLREQIRDNVIAPYKLAGDLTKGRTLQGEFAQSLTFAFHKRLPAYRALPYLEGVRRIFEYTLKNLDMIETRLPELFAKDVTQETMTYRKANVLQYLTTARFMAKYAIRSLNRITANEANIVLNQKAKIDDFLSPAELRWFQENTGNFLDALAALDVDPATFGRTIDAIPQIVVNENHPTIAASVGARQLDPMRLGLVSARLNPLYFIRRVIAEWQVASIKSKQEEKKMLELRLLKLKEAYQGKDDPRLSQQIEYNEGRLQKLTVELEEIESQYR